MFFLQEMQNNDFNAEKWLSQVTQVFESKLEVQKGSKNIYNMREKRINVVSFPAKLEQALSNANAFAEFYLMKSDKS